jgi:hypothetical protein
MTENDDLLIIDLCCGIGRFQGDNIISIDYDKNVRPTICADIKHLPLRQDLNIRHVHASPTCTYFSKARRWAYGWNPKGIAESLKLIASCYEAFAYLGCKSNSLENPAGLEQILGHKVQFKYDKYDHKSCTTNFYLSRKSHKRSIIPQDVRQTILEMTE